MSSSSPILWIVATPLGNLGDFSPRAREILASADIVLAEDTRRAGILCQNCGITVRHFMSFHDHNEDSKLQSVLAELKSGSTFALVSDAGMPLVADPGYRLVRACRAAGIAVSVIPGASAPVTALAGSGIPPIPFTFLGFLPRERSNQEKILAPFIHLQMTIIFFERKDRLPETLCTASRLLGEREICIARELTKMHEEFVCGRMLDGQVVDLSGSILHLENLLGEITVILGPPEKPVLTSREEVIDLLEKEYKNGGSPREIARRVQIHTHGWTGREIYALLCRVHNSSF